MVVTGGGGGGGGASLVGGGATLGDGSALGGGGGSGLGDGSWELTGGGGGGTAVVLLGNVGARSVVLVSVNATPPIAIIEIRAASPKNNCGKRFPRCGTSSGSTFGSCNS